MTRPTVYSKPVCVQCIAVKRYLDSNHIPYNEADATAPEVLTLIHAMKIQQAPVVVYGPTRGTPEPIVFSGNHPGKLDELRDAYYADHPEAA